MMTWYGYRTAIDEELVLANAKIVGELFGGYPQKMQALMVCDHGWQQESNRAGTAIDDRGTRGTLIGMDDPHGGYGHKDEDSQYPVGPVDPPGPEAHHAAWGSHT